VSIKDRRAECLVAKCYRATASGGRPDQRTSGSTAGPRELDYYLIVGRD